MIFVSEGLTEPVSEDVSIKLKTLRNNDVFESLDIINIEQNKLRISAKGSDLDYFFTGTFKGGYKLIFENSSPVIEGNVVFKPHPKSFLFYNGGKPILFSDKINLKGYDLFLCDVEGKLKVSDMTYDLKNARGILQHFGGALDLKTVKRWNWINLQFSTGAMQAFFMDISLNKEIHIPINEGAAVFEDKFMYFIDNNITLTPTSYQCNESFDTEVPAEWKLNAKSKNGDSLNLTLKSTIEYGILGVNSGKPIIESILAVTGDINGKAIAGNGTMELLVERKNR